MNLGKIFPKSSSVPKECVSVRPLRYGYELAKKLNSDGLDRDGFGLIFLSISVWVAASHEEAEQARLLTNIGEIERIDEVLSSSALLATATGDQAYKARYNAHVGLLDKLLADTRKEFGTPKISSMLAEVQSANDVLVALETRALDATIGQPNPQAYALLTTENYQKNKRIYAAGTEAAFAEMQVLAEQKIKQMRLALMALALISIVLTAVTSRLIWKSRIEALAHRQQDAQFETMRAMIRTFMDVQNNLLNNMVYFRTKAAHNLPFDDDEVHLIDDQIDLAKRKLADIAATDIAEVRDLGGIVVMATGNGFKHRAKEVPPELAEVA